MRTLPPDVHLYRFRVVQNLLGLGIPVTKADGLRKLLERAGTALSSRQHLATTYVPLVKADEFKKLLGEIQGQMASLIFDGSER